MSIKKDPFRVTDHCVLRYMERAMGLNVEIVRQHIEGICKGPAAVGAVSVRSEGVRFEIRNNTVLTVAPDRTNPSNTGRAIVQDKIQRKKREQEDKIGIRRVSWPVADCDAVGSPGGGAGRSADPVAAGFPAGPVGSATR
jgi:hypothetical protein